MADKVGFMRRLNLFEHMSEAEIEQISGELRMRHCQAHHSVYEGAPDRVYLLKEGRVRLFHLSPEGEEVTTAVLVPGQLFGLTSLFGGRSEDLNAKAIEDSYVCEAGTNEFLGILAKHPLMMAKVMMAMAKQMFSLERTIEGLARESVDSRLARVLVELMNRDGDGGGGPDGQLPPLSREELAKVAVTTRESVSRTLSQWSKKGIVELRGRRITVRDADRLRRLIHVAE